MLAFSSVEDKGQPLCWTVVSARVVTGLLALTAGSAIELDRRSAYEVARGQVRLFSEQRGDASPSALVHFRAHDVDAFAAELATEASTTP